MFMPSARNWEEMKYETEGCWPLPIDKGDEFALVTKMGVSSIKGLCIFYFREFLGVMEWFHWGQMLWRWSWMLLNSALGTLIFLG
jgi:hypothetical protein